MTLQHPLDQALALSPRAEHRFAGQTSPAYANMVGPFGGTTCAVLLQAALLHPQRLGDPIALTVNFASPVADGAFEIDARPARTNRSTQHWVMQLLQADGVAATATAVFAQRRPTWSAAEAQAPKGMPPADSLPRASLKGRPPWVRQFDMRFAEGGMPEPFDGQEQPHARSRLWVRDEPPRTLDFAALASLCDSFFPRVYIRRRKVVPIGTVSLTTYFHADAAQLAAQGQRHLLATARALAYRNGYFDQTAEMWGEGGQLLASTHQMVYFRE
jgi:acyl-CoA thioesterase